MPYNTSQSYTAGLPNQDTGCCTRSPKRAARYLDKTGWQNSFAGILAGVLTYGFLRSWPSFFRQIARYLSNETQTIVTDRDIAITSSYILAGLACGATACGYILPRIGNRLATALSGCAASAGMAAVSLILYTLPSRLWIIYAICFTLIGIPLGIIMTSGQNSIKTAVPENKRGFSLTMFSLGFTVGPLFLPFLFTWLYTITTVPYAILISAIIFTPLIGSSRVLVNSSTETPTLIDCELFKIKDYVIFTVHIALTLTAYLASFTYFPLYIELEASRNTTDAATVDQVRNKVQTVMSICELGGRAIGMVTADRVNKAYILQGTYALQFVAWSLLLFGNTWFFKSSVSGVSYMVYLYGAGGLSGIGVGAMGVLYSMLAEVVPSEKHASALGMMLLTTGTFNFLGINAMAVAWDGWSAKAPFAITLGLYIIGSIGLCFVRSKNPT